MVLGLLIFNATNREPESLIEVLSVKYAIAISEAVVPGVVLPTGFCSFCSAPPKAPVGSEITSVASVAARKTCKATLVGS